ncbi:MAG: 7-carboxy-7-deazaguanine synthase QueE [Nitrosomonas sp.]|jgi:7-carboxy-7-deazaguanine synthase|uniref:7-carboxy-7-deazaguanine synthase QueE n=1 Tax=Nitrosomonas sp. TaxID=42353 RepID=UPI001DFA20BA|nr:7-carboxy-7-deazaguanine synthase QueE [Nitrosomonas sp.]MBX9893603.1 7-carboxy-7-deazaguanine synthase QueE [Nitrosomonas sp.]
MQALETATLRITEIFFSLQGETSRVGLPTVFVRLTGCPLRCGYCDTAYAFSGGETMAISAILQQVARYQTPYVTVTGGEPLAQKACLTLLAALCDAHYSVSLETSGALDLSQVDARVSKIMDIKTPGSGEVSKNNWNNLDYLTPHDEIKFVICDESDYRWACEIIQNKQLPQKCPILFSPVHGSLAPATLANWILRDQLPVRMQLQLHKLLWGEGPGR